MRTRRLGLGCEARAEGPLWVLVQQARVQVAADGGGCATGGAGLGVAGGFAQRGGLVREPGDGASGARRQGGEDPEGRPGGLRCRCPRGGPCPLPPSHSQCPAVLATLGGAWCPLWAPGH